MPVSDRQQREREARIHMILSAALTIFARSGYHGTSMDQIAEQAELGKATLYYYFKSKEDLLLALLEEGMRSFFQQLEEAWQTAESPVEKIQQVTRVGASFFASNPDYFRLYSYLMAHPSLRSRAFPGLRSLLTEKLTKIRNVFLEAQNRGLIKPVPVDELISIFGSLVMGMGFLPHHEEAQHDLSRRAELINEIFLQGILTKREGN